MLRPRAALWRHTRFPWPTCPSTQRRRAPSKSWCRSPRHGGPLSQRNAHCVQTSTIQAGRCWNTWRGTRYTPPPRRTTRRRPPTSSKGGQGGPRGMPRMPGAPRRRRLATQTARRRHPGRPRGRAMQPNRDPSPRDWPPWPPCGPRCERAPHTPWPRHTQEIWRLRRTRRQCRCGTADSRRTRRATPYGSSPGTYATASSHQTGPSGTRSDGAGGWRPVATRSASSPACYPGRGALPSCSRKQGSPPGRRRCTWPRHFGRRGTPPSSAAGWRRRGPPPPQEGEASSPRSAASLWRSTRCSVSQKSSPGRPRTW